MPDAPWCEMRQVACTEAGLLHVLRDVYVHFVKTTPVVRLVLSELPLADEANLAQLEVRHHLRFVWQVIVIAFLLSLPNLV